MHAAIETADLPFVERQRSSTHARRRRKPVQDGFLALRHAQVTFRSDDRLLLLHGHPLVFRIALYAATERVLDGEPVVYIDGANTFDPLVIEGLARAHRRQPGTMLAMTHVARAFTCHQMERLVSDCLRAALERYQARIAILSGLFDTFYDQAVPEQESLRLFSRMMEAIEGLAKQGYTLVCLCPSAPILTRNSQRCLDQLRGRAERVIRIHDGEGIIRFDEETQGIARSWQVARSLLEPVNRANS